MRYKGKLYAKCAGKYIPLEMTNEDVDAVVSERDRMLKALTPSVETKVAYMNEFFWKDRGGMEHTVPWTVVKQIMAAIRERAALKGNSDAT